MKKRETLKRAYSVLLAFVLVFGMCTTAYGAVARATTMRLAATTGSRVTLKTISGSKRKITKNMRLYNGNVVETGAGSYAYISLDSSKAVKVDANAKVQVRQDGKKLKLLVSRGKLFFNVKVPLKSNESLDVQTSTMVTGVRGTCGIIESVSSDTASVYLLEGALEINWKDPVTGASEPIALKSGQKLTLSKKATKAPAAEVLAPEDVPAFAAEEVAKDEALQKKITEMGGPDVSKIIETVSPGEPSQPTKPEQPAQPDQPTKPEQPEQPTQPENPSEPSGPSQPVGPEKPTMPNWNFNDKDIHVLSGNDLANACKDINAEISSNDYHTVYLNGDPTPEAKTFTLGEDVTILKGKTLVLHGVALEGKNLTVENGGSLYIDADASLKLDSITVKPGGKVYTFGTLTVDKKEGNGEILTGGDGKFVDTSKQTNPEKPDEIKIPDWDLTNKDIQVVDMETYKEPVNWLDVIMAALKASDKVYVKGSPDGANSISLDGISINGNKTLVLNGVTVTGQEWTVGGSLYIAEGASLQLDSITVGSGGTVYTFGTLAVGEKKGDGDIQSVGNGKVDYTKQQPAQ